MNSNHFPVVIVGGGIVGAGIFRDLSLHGVKSLIIDKKDFSSQTSERSSKMLHGGIRYLENFDFSLVFEALHEKNLWLKIAPELATEKEFILPIYENSKRPLWQIGIGLFLYDLLSGFKNKPFKILSPKETLDLEPKLNPQGLKGAGVYADAIIEDATMTLHCIYDGLNFSESKAQNYTSLKDIQKSNGTNVLTLFNEITHELFHVTADHVVFALGPFTDQVLKNLSLFKWTDVLLPSKGSHLWIKKERLAIDRPLVITSHDKEDRVIFVIPHHDKILVGTTELATKENYFDVLISKEETLYLLRHLNDYFPSLNINEDDIISSFAGIRPLVKESNDNLSKTSREHKTYRPFSDIFVIAGGKYTTFRTMGQEITRNILLNYQKAYNHEMTLNAFRTKSILSQEIKQNHSALSLEKLETIICTESPKTFEDLVKRRLCLPSRKLWTGNQEFNHFFTLALPLMNKYFHVSPQEIERYP